MEVKELLPNPHHVQRLTCENCGHHLDLHFCVFEEVLTGVELCLHNVPVLRCDKCSREFLPDRSRFMILEEHRKALEKHKNRVTANRKKSDKEFGFCSVQFKYDSDDYYFIPGLLREWNDGFLTPVFFNRKVLLKYDVSPSYQLIFCSSSYGDIVKNEEYSIPFGLNKNGKVIMWLGDIDRLPEDEQYYLRSENVDSDHSVGCEFYDGQIDCVFPELSPEDKAFKARSEFLSSVFKRYGVKIAHLDKEVIELARSLNKPLFDTDTPQETKHVADTLNKIYIESFDNRALKRLISSLGGDPSKLRCLKRLQLLMQHTTSAVDLECVMAVFYILYDFRVLHLHITSSKEYGDKLSEIKERLSLRLSAGLPEIYNAIIVGLAASFVRLKEIVDAIDGS